MKTVLLSSLFLLPLSLSAIDFNQHIRPILSDRCFHCHGPDSNDRKAGLRLDVREAAMNETESGLKAIEPGNAAKSEIIRRILSEDPDEVMPPPKSKLSLTKAERDTLVAWVDAGAEYAGHWAFESISKPVVPKVKHQEVIENPIDAFIQARLEKEDWSLASEAGRERLIRRVTFDITGLPPTPEEVNRFLADTSPNAFEDLVRALLKREAYGERMAAEWMDVARYSDSYGYQVDRDRYVWPWRDWVIEAFNDNLPYDQFVTWQLAGDLLPNPTREQRLATTFNRLHSQKVEGGSVPEEFRIEYVADRAHTFGTAFLGLTLECSRCHDHKYDPLSQKEYYQLSSFFANIDEAGLYSYFTPAIPTPNMLLTTEEQEVKLAELEAKISIAETKLESSTAPKKQLPVGQIAHFTFDEREDGKFVNAKDAEKPASASGANVSVPGRYGNAVQLTGDDAVNLKQGNFTRNDPFSIALWLKAPAFKERMVVLHRSRAWTDAASRGYEMLLMNGRVRWSLIHFWPGNAISVETTEPIHKDAWTHVGLTYDGSSRADGVAVYVNGEPVKVEIVRDNLYKNITGGGGDHIALGQRFRDIGFTKGLIDELRVFNRELQPEEMALICRLDEVSLSTPILTEQQDHQTLIENLLALRKARSELADGIQEIMVMDELPTPRQSYLLARGAYDARSEPVASDTPATLPPMKADHPRNRLGLAQWLTDADHPLLARVTVNRYWQMFFGKGLVGTPEDFGSQGALPTHPELLDWLAADFMEHGWNVKRLVKTMVLSRAYRQQSIASPDQETKDPGNELLARAPRYRLPAEMIRDNALAVGDLLVKKVGGAPTKPYEVAVSFKPVEHEKGEGLYRRSLYTYWKRTSPAPVMIALDAPKRDVCMVKRERTSTPIQAFVFLNDPQFVEAARELAANLIKHYGEDYQKLLPDLFLRLTSRHPQKKEMNVLTSLLDDQLAHFRLHPDEAVMYLKNGNREPSEDVDSIQHAAIASVANALMSYDECVMKR